MLTCIILDDTQPNANLNAYAYFEMSAVSLKTTWLLQKSVDRRSLLPPV